MGGSIHRTDFLTLGIEDHSPSTRLLGVLPHDISPAIICQCPACVSLRHRQEQQRARAEADLVDFRRQVAAGYPAPLLNGHDFSTDDHLRTGRTFERAYPGSSRWVDTGQLDRIETLLQELVDQQRRENLERELDRLTRGWRP